MTWQLWKIYTFLSMDLEGTWSPLWDNLSIKSLHLLPSANPLKASILMVFIILHQKSSFSLIDDASKHRSNSERFLLFLNFKGLSIRLMTSVLLSLSSQSIQKSIASSYLSQRIPQEVKINWDDGVKDFWTNLTLKFSRFFVYKKLLLNSQTFNLIVSKHHSIPSHPKSFFSPILDNQKSVYSFHGYQKIYGVKTIISQRHLIWNFFI